ncbi:MAG: sugar-binding protein [Bacillota bacterium]
MKRLFVVGLVVLAMAISAFAAWNGDWNKWQKVDVSGLPKYAVDTLKSNAFTIPKAKGAMVVDGLPNEEDWKTSAVISINEDMVEEWQQFGTHITIGEGPDDAKDSSGLFYFLHDGKNMYAFCVISDEKFVAASSGKCHNDAVEFFFDPTNEKGNNIQKYYGAVNLIDNSDKEFADTPNSVVKRGRWSGGWTLEFNVLMTDVAADLAALDGKTIGFDVQFDDADDASTAAREYAMVWSGGENQSWLTAEYNGSITFAP